MYSIRSVAWKMDVVLCNVSYQGNLIKLLTLIYLFYLVFIVFAVVALLFARVKNVDLAEVWCI